MKCQINIQFQCSLKEIHELMIIELGRQTVLKRNLCAGSWDLDASHATLEEKDADLIARDCDVNFIVLLFRISLPRDKHTFITEIASRVFVGAKFGLAACALEFPLVVVLLGKWKKEALFAAES
jgi:hypothetical protein